MEERPKPPFSNIVAGSIIYWICLTACMFSMIGPVVSIAVPDNNIANPYYVFDLVWEGKKSDEIWAAVTQEGKYPGPHFWVKHLNKGDGITQLGAWLGCACALPAAFFAGLAFLVRGPRLYFIIAIWASFMILFAMMGIVKMK